MHLADAFIQSDLQYMQVIHVLSACVFPGKTQFIAAMEASKRTGSEITDYTRPKKHLHPSKMLYDHRHIKMQVNPPISVVKNIDISISIDTEISERYQY